MNDAHLNEIPTIKTIQRAHLFNDQIDLAAKSFTLTSRTRMQLVFLNWAFISLSQF